MAAQRRSTESSTVARTSAATAARRRLAAERAALRLGLDQLDALPDRYLVALTETLITELMRRDLADKLFEKK